MSSPGLSRRRVGAEEASTPTNSASLCWIPFWVPETTKRIYPFIVSAACVNTLLKLASLSLVKRITAALPLPKIGSM